jgi:hypothetical protein
MIAKSRCTWLGAIPREQDCIISPLRDGNSDNDAERPLPLAILVAPIFPDAGDAERRAVGHGEGVQLLAFVAFVASVGWAKARSAVPTKPFRKAQMSRYRRLKIECGAFFSTLELADPGSGLLVRQIERLRRCIAAKTAHAPALSHYRKYGREFIGRPRGLHPA